jgi:hypothetical protein
MALYQCDAELNDSEIMDIVAFLRTLTGEYKGVKLTTENEYGEIFHHDHDHDHDHDHE